jgi:uncharacterized membrane protein YcaP (DUF421 family)
VVEALWEQFRILLGLGANVSDVDAVQMALRTIIIYAVTLAIVRLGSKRFLSEATAFDVIVSIMLGSIMSRAINGSAPFMPTLAAGVVLVGLHWLFAMLAYRTGWFGSLIKGDPVLLIKDGDIQQEGMWRASITSKDLAAALRLQTNQTDPAKVQLAYLERNGRISIVPYPHESHVIDVSVKDGVQTVRIEFDRSNRERPASNKAAKDSLNHG